MTRKQGARALSLIAALIFTFQSATQLQAALVTWSIDSSKSKVTLAIPDTKINIDGTSATLRMRNQTGSSNSWNVGSTAFFGGLLNTDFNMLGDTIQFLNNPTGQVYGINSGNYRPNPASFNSANSNVENPYGQFENASTAPAVFGAKLRSSVTLLNPDGGYLAIDDVSYNMTSGVTPLAGPSGTWTFPATAVDFGIADAVYSFDGLPLPLGIGQPLPDTLNASITNWMGDNIAGGSATINLTGFVATLTVPINVPIVIDFFGTPLNASLTGSLVAYAMPEPSSLVLSLSAVGLVAVTTWRKRRRVASRAGRR